jgi:hypothetical protein
LERSNHLDIILEGLVSRLQSERARLLTAYNAGSWVNQLPAEILSGIFLLYVNRGPETREISLKNLVIVCNLWKDLVLRSPHLWTVLDARLQGSSGFMRVSVSRSKGLPLTLNATEEWLLRNKRITLPPQIQSLSYTGMHHKIIEHCLPTLRDLHAVHENNGDTEDMEDKTANLAITAGVPFRSLSLKGIFFTSCDWDRLKHLHFLNLVDIAFYEPSFFPPFFHALAASTKLQTLVIHGLRAFSTSYSVRGMTITEVPQLHFPILRTISIKEAPISFTTAFMQTISLPQCSSIFLDDLGAQEIPASGWLARAVQSRLIHASKLEIKVIIGKGASYDLSNPVGNEWILITRCRKLDINLNRLTEFGRLLKDTNCETNIAFHLKHPYYLSRPMVLDVYVGSLQDLGNVVHMTIGATCDATSLLRALSWVEDNQTMWPCPCLQSVHIDTYNSSLYEEGFLGADNDRWEILPRDDESEFLILKSREFAPPPASL